MYILYMNSKFQPISHDIVVINQKHNVNILEGKIFLCTKLTTLDPSTKMRIRRIFMFKVHVVWLGFF